MGTVLAVRARAGRRLHKSAELQRRSSPLQCLPAQPSMRLLIVGESTAVRTGATVPEGSLTGLLGRRFPRLQIVNRSRDGATVAGLLAQLDGDERFDRVC